MKEQRRYTYGATRLKRSLIDGFLLTEGDRLMMEGEKDMRRIFLCGLYGEAKGNAWGRLHLDMQLPQEGILSVYVMDMDEKEEKSLDNMDVPAERKAAIFYEYGKKVGTNCSDMLLYNFQRKYLYIYIEAAGKGDGWISNIFVECPGDSFLGTFPEIYQEQGGFFHRYLSVLSVVYRDLEYEITEAPKMISTQCADEELQKSYARWLGGTYEDAGLSLEEQRKLLCHLYWLNRRKGTKAAVYKLTELLMGERAIVIVRNRPEIILLFRQKKDVKKAGKVIRVLKEFIPIGSKLRFAFSDDPIYLDDVSCLDVNGKLTQFQTGVLGNGAETGSSILEG